MPEIEHRSLEERWRQRLEDAKLRVIFARNWVNEVHRDLPSPDIPAVDGNLMLQRAIRAENEALQEYNRVLRIFMDLVVDGIIPEEPGWHKRQAAGEGEVG